MHLSENSPHFKYLKATSSLQCLGHCKCEQVISEGNEAYRGIFFNVLNIN